MKSALEKLSELCIKRFFFQFVITSSRNEATITIKHAETIDCGQYTIKLFNEISEVSADFVVSIKGR